MTILAIGFFILGRSRWDETIHDAIEWLGLGLIILCILGRTWCALYIGGRKTVELVDIGPYSITRNPLYVFSIIGAFGAGAQLGSFVVALAAASIAAIVFVFVVWKEEQFLLERFGAPFREYMARVPRFIPNPRLWRGVETLSVRPSRILMTFVDATLFLIAIPLAEGFEYLQAVGYLPVLFYLP